MASIKVPTSEQFSALIGRSSFGRIFKTKNDHGEILEALSDFDPLNSSIALQAVVYLREIRRQCVRWLVKNNGVKRASRTAVEDLLARANERYLAIMELYHHREGQGTNVTQGQALAAKPKLPDRPIGGIGKSLSDALAKEYANPMHLGPRTVMTAETQYRQYYRNRGGRALTMGAWYKYIYPADVEDGLHQVGLGVPGQGKGFNKALGGVKYCTAQERAVFEKEPRGDGCLYDIQGQKFDTTGMRTHFSEYGWAIFVLGFDNRLYSNTHEVDIFHHSSFFAGNPVQCGGEICVIGGELRYITAKTGHYKSSYWDLYRVLHFLSYHGIDLSKVLACPEPWKGIKFWSAAEIFAHGGKTAAAGEFKLKPVVNKQPKKLKKSGVPEWPPGWWNA